MASTRHNLQFAAKLAAAIICMILLIAFAGFSRPVHAAATTLPYPSDIHFVNEPNEEYFLTDIDGSQVSTKADGKAKILFFFNTTCPRCNEVESLIKTYGINSNKVDFIMAESSINGITEEQAKNFYDKCEIESAAQCYQTVDVCWKYLKSCGYSGDETKKPVVVYISADDEILGYSWSYTNIYTAAQVFGITLEKNGHQWEEVSTTVEEDGYASTYRRCAACRLERMHSVEPPVAGKTEFTYTGKAQTVLPNTSVYTVIDGSMTAAGEYEATLHLRDTSRYVWSDGDFRDKTVTWSITKASQKPVITTSKKSFKKSSLKSKAQSFTLGVTKAHGTKTFTKVSGSSRLSLSKTTGKVTVKKGTAKGTYTIKVKVSAAGTSNYKAGASATKTVKVTVK